MHASACRCRCCSAPCMRWGGSSVVARRQMMTTWRSASHAATRIACPLPLIARAYHQHNHSRFYRGPHNNYAASQALWVRGGGGGDRTRGAAHTATSPLYAAFMGSSTPFASPARDTPETKEEAEGTAQHALCDGIALTTEHIAEMERAPLAHSAPGRINDHVCILMVKLLRWIADRLFRERYLHRATMLKTMSPATAAAAGAAALVRLACLPRRTLRTATAFVAPVAHAETSDDTRTPREAVPPQTQATATAAAALPAQDTPRPAQQQREEEEEDEGREGNAAAAELRGLLSQLECHVAHWHILIAMADITLAERTAVALAQLAHFALCFLLFTFYSRMGFRLCGYLAEESSVVWTQMVNDIDLGKLETPVVPPLAYSYWHLRRPTTTTAATTSDEKEREGKMQEQADTTSPSSPQHTSGKSQRRKTHADRPATVSPLSLREVVLLIRADEMVYRDLNHAMADALDRRPRSSNTLRNRFLRYCGVKE